MRNKKLIFAGLLLFICAGAGIVYLYPLPFLELRAIARQKSDGANFTEIAGLKAAEYNTCQNAENCHCLAFLHGFADSIFTWNKLLDIGLKSYWQKDHHLVVFNLPGTQSYFLRPSVEKFSYVELAESIASELPKKCADWTLVGNSAGGWLATLIAAEIPTYVQSLILINPAGNRAGNADMSHAAELLVKPSIVSLREFQTRAFSVAPRVPDRIWNQVVARLKSFESELGQIVDINRSQVAFADTYADKITAKVTLIWGAADRVLAPTNADEWKKLLGEKLRRFELLEGCGHLPQKECPEKLGPLFAAAEGDH